MQIKTIEPIAVSLPMLKPVVMAGEEVRRADNVLVRIETDSGVVGWGEAASAPVMTGDTLESIVSAIHYLSSTLRNRDPADIAGALTAMDGLHVWQTMALRAAIEIALLDIAGLSTAKPVYALLGDKKRSRMPLLGVIGGGDREGDLRDAEKRRRQASPRTKSRSALTRRRTTRRARARFARLSAMECSFRLMQTRASALLRPSLTCMPYEDRESISSSSRLQRTIWMGWQPWQPQPKSRSVRTRGIHSSEDIRRHHERKAARGVSLKAIKLRRSTSRDRGRKTLRQSLA